MAKTEEIVNSVSRISAGTDVTGKMTSTNDLRIDGSFHGNLFIEGRIVVGENATVSGVIICSNADIFGKISGDIYVKDTFCMKKGSAVDGNINIRKLVVDLGASVNGSFRMIEEPEFEKVVSNLKKDEE